MTAHRSGCRVPALPKAVCLVMNFHPAAAGAAGCFPPQLLAIGGDRSGEATARLLSAVIGRLAADASWRPLLGELLDVDEVRVDGRAAAGGGIGNRIPGRAASRESSCAESFNSLQLCSQPLLTCPVPSLSCSCWIGGSGRVRVQRRTLAAIACDTARACTACWLLCCWPPPRWHRAAVRQLQQQQPLPWRLPACAALRCAWHSWQSAACRQCSESSPADRPRLRWQPMVAGGMGGLCRGSRHRRRKREGVLSFAPRRMCGSA